MHWYIVVIVFLFIAVICAGFAGFVFGRNKLFSKEPVGTLWISESELYLEIENIEKLNGNAVIMRVKHHETPQE